MVMVLGKILCNFEDEVLRMWCIVWVVVLRLVLISKEVVMVFFVFFYFVGSYFDLGLIFLLVMFYCSFGWKYFFGLFYRMLVCFFW